MDEWQAMLLILAAMLLLGVPLIVWIVLASLRREVERLRQRIVLLEYKVQRAEPPLSAVPPEPEASEPPPAPIPITSAPTHAGEPHASQAPAEVPAAIAPPHDRSVEQLVGGVWLQNVGSVLLLLGVFFWILWSYTTGRLGPGWLVLSGVLLGFAFVWRGDRIARAVPAFGHALVGVGLGIVYLALYLGHFTLHALDGRLAFVSLLGTSLLAIFAGLHYRVQSIAVLGVVGAFLPQMLAVWVPLPNFALAPWPLLGYLAVVDLAVFVLAARAGWGGLDLTALLFTTITWFTVIGDRSTSWSVQIALSALYSLLGLASVPRASREEVRIRPSEMAVVVLAPLALLLVSAPFLSRLPPRASAMLLLGHAIVYLLAALWAEPRRRDEALWRPLTAAATLFFTSALALFAGNAWTPVAWCTEGSLLLWVGLGRHGWWLRVCGYLVSALGFVWVLAERFTGSGWASPMAPVFHPEGIRSGLAILVLVVTAIRLARARPSLPADEQALSRGYTAAVNVLVMIYTAVEASHTARALEEPGGRWAGAIDPRATPVVQRVDTLVMKRVDTLAAMITSGTWMLQAVVLLAIGWRIASSYARWLGLVLIGITVLKVLFFDLAQVDVFWRFLSAIVVGAALLGISYFYQRRARGDRAERTERIVRLH